MDVLSLLPRSERWIIETMRLVESLPDLSRELVELLLAAREPSLAAQIADLEIVAKCSCSDDFCASFYTAPKPIGSYGPKHRNLELAPARGMLILDLVDDRIVHVEVLYRDDVRSKLTQIFA
jgi:hypothetical protein